MKIEQKHVKHKTWHTKVTVGEGKEAKTFGLRRFKDGFRVHVPFGGSQTQDFDTRDEALEFCQA